MKKLIKVIKKEKGISLIEILLAIAIIGVVISMSTGMITQAFRIIIPSSERMSVKQMAEINLTEISAYVRNAKDVDTSNNTITTIKDHTLSKSGDKIVVKDENDNTIRTFNNISNFDLNEDNNVYTIIIEKCSNEDCSKVIHVETDILPRN